jgi:aspartate oxidase
MFRQFQRFGWDIRRHPVLVYPTLHYQNGGLVVDVDGETAVRNLFAVGEVVGGIHGRNRLMGNSLLEIFTFGRHIGKVVAQRARETDFGPLTTQHLEKFAARPRPKWVGVRSPILLPNYVRKE